MKSEYAEDHANNPCLTCGADPGVSCPHDEPLPRRPKVGPTVCLDWVDGPLLEIARLDFGDREPLVQIGSVGWTEGDPPRQMHYIRISREDLVKALDLIDGKPVTGYADGDYDEIPVDASGPCGSGRIGWCGTTPGEDP